MTRAQTPPKTRGPVRRILRGVGKVMLWIFGALAILIAGVMVVPNFPFGPYVLYTDMTDTQKADVIPYARLADSQTELNYKPAFIPDAKALKRFPGVRSCLVRSQRKAETPDLRLIDWNRIYRDEEAEICMWWIFSSLETPERAKAWMEFHEMVIQPSKHVLDRTNIAGKFVSKPDDKIGYALNAQVTNWKDKTFLYPNRGIGYPFRIFWGERYYTVNWDIERNPRYVAIRFIGE